MVQCERSCHNECTCAILKLYHFKVMAKVKVFLKVGQTQRSRSRVQKLRYHVKCLVTRNTHMQYESPITSSKKVMTKVKVFVHAHGRRRGRARAMTLAPWIFVLAR